MRASPQLCHLDHITLPSSKEHKVHVLYFSFLSHSKGVFTALKSVIEVVKKDRNVYFTFGGPFESVQLKQDMDCFVEEHGLSRHVEFLGYIDSEKRRTEILRSADIFIFPTHRDVFGLVLLHAMAEGLPIIASREGAIPEIVEDNEGGFLFSKGDETQLAEKIVTLCGNFALRDKMGERNRQRYLEMYTPQRYGNRMIHAFDQIRGFVTGSPCYERI